MNRAVFVCWLSLLLAGCGSGGDSKRQNDDAGPRRVISLVPSATEVILALGRGDRLVGRTRYDDDPRIAGLPSVGGTVDASLELVMGLEPELVVGWRSEGAEAQHRYARLGVDLRMVGTETIAEFRETVDSLGRWLDAGAEAESLLAAVDTSFARVRAAGTRRKPMSLFFAVWLDPPMTAGPGTFVSELITLSGARNIFDDLHLDWPTVSLETVVHRNPDVLIWTRSPEVVPWAQMLAAHPEWRKVRAVRTGRVLEVDGDLFNRPGPRLGYAAEVLSDALDSIARH